MITIKPNYILLHERQDKRDRYRKCLIITLQSKPTTTYFWLRTRHYDHNLLLHPVNRSLLPPPPLVDPSLLLPVLDDDDDCIHPPDSRPYNNKNNNNNSHSVVDKRPCRSNKNNPINTPSKQERNAFTSSSNHLTPFRSPVYPKTTQTL